MSSGSDSFASNVWSKYLIPQLPKNQSRHLPHSNSSLLKLDKVYFQLAEKTLRYILFGQAKGVQMSQPIVKDGPEDHPWSSSRQIINIVSFILTVQMIFLN